MTPSRDDSSPKVLLGGDVAGPLLVLDEPLSFWGGFDPETGNVIDRNHPQAGLSLSGQAILIEGTRGSPASPAALVQAIRSGTGPIAILTRGADLNCLTAGLIADELYGLRVPLLSLSDSSFQEARSKKYVSFIGGVLVFT